MWLTDKQRYYEEKLKLFIDYAALFECTQSNIDSPSFNLATPRPRSFHCRKSFGVATQRFYSSHTPAT
jgi:hypothetical protein